MHVMKDKIIAALNNTIDQIPTIAVPHQGGKVRESYLIKDERAIVVTDRISAFDFILGTVPFKGQVLNQIAAWWFEKIRGKIPHHFLSSPHPNISLTKNAQVLPVEIVVRGYLTGTTKTSAWYAYQHLDRQICGLEMPAGMTKNQPFAEPIITPTTKPAPGSQEHDVPISRQQIIAENLVSEKIYTQAEQYARALFAIGQAEAAKRGLILVDTKYEMGLDAEGNLMVIDEIHTPDSSRYWIAETYQSRLENNKEPDMLDKEFVRSMIVNAGYDVNDDTQNPADFLTDEMRIAASERYVQLYETITGQPFVFPEEGAGVSDISNTLRALV